MPLADQIILTEHAIKRLRKRLGLNKSSVMFDARRAATKGFKIRSLPAHFKSHLAARQKTFGQSTHYRVTPSGVFVFSGTKLITVFPIPVEYRNHFMEKWNRRKEMDAVWNERRKTAGSAGA